jgi:hypothetical protein
VYSSRYGRQRIWALCARPDLLWIVVVLGGLLWVCAQASDFWVLLVFLVRRFCFSAGLEVWAPKCACFPFRVRVVTREFRLGFRSWSP